MASALKGLDDPDLALIEVEAESAQYWTDRQHDALPVAGGDRQPHRPRARHGRERQGRAQAAGRTRRLLPAPRVNLAPVPFWAGWSRSGPGAAARRAIAARCLLPPPWPPEEVEGLATLSATWFSFWSVSFSSFSVGRGAAPRRCGPALRQRHEAAVAGDLVMLDLLRVDDHADVEHALVLDVLHGRAGLLEQPFHGLAAPVLGHVELLEHLLEPLDLAPWSARDAARRPASAPGWWPTWPSWAGPSGSASRHGRCHAAPRGRDPARS